MVGVGPRAAAEGDAEPRLAEERFASRGQAHPGKAQQHQDQQETGGDDPGQQPLVEQAPPGGRGGRGGRFLLAPFVLRRVVLAWGRSGGGGRRGRRRGTRRRGRYRRRGRGGRRLRWGDRNDGVALGTLDGLARQSIRDRQFL